jgi:hypothetical protein
MRVMAMWADPCVILEHKVGMRVRDDDSHRRIAEALTDIAVAAIHPARHLGVGQGAPQGMFEDPIQSATQAAVETLVQQLEDLVETLPRQTIDELVDEQLVAEHGFA